MTLRDRSKHTGVVISDTLDIYCDYAPHKLGLRMEFRFNRHTRHCKAIVRYDGGGVAVKFNIIKVDEKRFYVEALSRTESAGL